LPAVEEIASLKRPQDFALRSQRRSEGRAINAINTRIRS
jgi:hypothetical protein